jgi:hypothetical protein
MAPQATRTRNYAARDAPEIVRLFFETVRSVNRADYSELPRGTRADHGGARREHDQLRHGEGSVLIRASSRARVGAVVEDGDGAVFVASWRTRSSTTSPSAPTGASGPKEPPRMRTWRTSVRPHGTRPPGSSSTPYGEATSRPSCRTTRSRRGPDTLEYLFVAYSADRATIIIGYQVSGVETTSRTGGGGCSSRAQVGRRGVVRTCVQVERPRVVMSGWPRVACRDVSWCLGPSRASRGRP